MICKPSSEKRGGRTRLVEYICIGNWSEIKTNSRLIWRDRFMTRSKDMKWGSGSVIWFSISGNTNEAWKWMQDWFCCLSLEIGLLAYGTRTYWCISYLFTVYWSWDLGPNPQQPAIASIFGDDGEQAFTVFMDDPMGAADSAFFLTRYKLSLELPLAVFIFRVIIRIVVIDQLEIAGFTGSAGDLRPSVKRRQHVQTWTGPTTREEPHVWILPFQFSCLRAEHVLKLKKAYLEEVLVGLVYACQQMPVSIRGKWVE